MEKKKAVYEVLDIDLFVYSILSGIVIIFVVFWQ